VLADNVVAHLRGLPLERYEHSYAGSVASLGLYKGVAEIYGIKLRGIAAWFMHRTYHVSRMPTWNRRFRIVIDWTTAMFFGREVVALGQIHDPRAEFSRVAGDPSPAPRAEPAERATNAPAGDGPEERSSAARHHG
jgi:NADH:ubiquinone reductase (H+-translocating)